MKQGDMRKALGETRGLYLCPCEAKELFMAHDYDYRESVKDDLVDWIEDGVIEMLENGEFSDIDEMR